MTPRLVLLFESASSVSGEVDFFFWLMVLLCGTVSFGIAAFLIYSAVRYRRKHADEMGDQIRNLYSRGSSLDCYPVRSFYGNVRLGSKLYFDIERPPDNALSMYAVGKQWMWKIQHPEGQREINELHIPVGRPVKLTMTSEDAIHSFFVPALSNQARHASRTIHNYLV